MGCFPSKEHPAEPDSTPYRTVFEVDGVQDIDGNSVDMRQFQGKVLMIVNIATKNPRCEAQLQELAELEKKYEPLGMVFMVFPCDDFHHQPADVAAVKAACSKAGYKGYIMQFAHVRGPNTHPLYVFLRLNDPDSKLLIGTDLTKAVTNKKGGVFGKWGIGAMPHALEPYLKHAVGGAATHKAAEPAA